MKRGRGQVIAGIVLMVGSVVAFVAGIIMIVTGAVSGASEIAQSEPFSLPAQNRSLSLEKDVYVVYVLQAAGTGPQVTASDVTVTSSGGSSITVTPETLESYKAASGTLGSVAKFTTPAAGTYSISVNGPIGSAATVSKSAFTMLGGLAGGGLVLVGSVLAFFVGVVLLIVGLVRGRRRPPAGGALSASYGAPGYPPQAPGYPPQAPGYPAQGPGYQGYPPPPGQGHPPQ